MTRTANPGHYDKYEFLSVSYLDGGVLKVVLDRPEKLNVVDAQAHEELARIWGDIDTDPKTSVALVTGAGRAFSAGGDLDSANLEDPESVLHTIETDSAIVHGMIGSRKPVVSAINGVAVGAGLAVALLADISVCSTEARLIDGHTKLGVVAGDHAAVIWPLLVGMARAKYYLLLCEELDGAEAYEAGLVSLCVEPDELMPRAEGIARRLAEGSQWAITGTKRVLNGWLRQALPIFDHSAAMELASFFLPDSREGMKAFAEKRRPSFPSNQSGNARQE